MRLMAVGAGGDTWADHAGREVGGYELAPSDVQRHPDVATDAATTQPTSFTTAP